MMLVLCDRFAARPLTYLVGSLVPVLEGLLVALTAAVVLIGRSVASVGGHSRALEPSVTGDRGHLDRRRVGVESRAVEPTVAGEAQEALQGAAKLARERGSRPSAIRSTSWQAFWPSMYWWLRCRLDIGSGSRWATAGVNPSTREAMLEPGTHSYPEPK